MSELITLPTSLSLDAVEQLSASKNEPEWMLQFRREAWQTFQQTPIADWTRGIRGWWAGNIPDSIFDNLKPNATLVIVNRKSGFESHPEDFEGAILIDLGFAPDALVLDEETVRDWWQDLDVVLSVETMYDWRLIEWAHADGPWMRREFPG